MFLKPLEVCLPLHIVLKERLLALNLRRHFCGFVHSCVICILAVREGYVYLCVCVIFQSGAVSNALEDSSGARLHLNVLWVSGVDFMGCSPPHGISKYFVLFSYLVFLGVDLKKRFLKSSFERVYYVWR